MQSLLRLSLRRRRTSQTRKTCDSVKRKWNSVGCSAVLYYQQCSSVSDAEPAAEPEKNSTDTEDM